MAEDLKRLGLELFAAGDKEGAVRAWLEARRQGKSSGELDAYLSHLRSLDPAMYAAVEAESDPRSAPALSSPAAPRTAPLVAAAPKPPSATPAGKPVRVWAPEALAVWNESRAQAAAGCKSAKAVASTSSLPITVPRPEFPASATDPWGGDSALGPPLAVSQCAGGLDLVVTPAAPAPAPVLAPKGQAIDDEARLCELLKLDDFTGALAVAQRIREQEPDHAVAQQAITRCRQALSRMYEAKIGALGTVPRVLLPPEQIIWLDLDCRAGFFLAQVDGFSSFEDLIALCGIDRLEALRILAQLVQKGVIGGGAA